MKTIEEDKQFIEELGVMLDDMGITPLQSRVACLLFLRYPSGLSFDEIVEFFGASKSSISTTLNAFLNANIVTYYTKPGDRKRYFKTPIASWLNDVEKKLDGMSNISTVLAKTVAYRDTNEGDFSSKCNEIIEFIDRIKSNIEQELMKFKQEKGY